MAVYRLEKDTGVKDEETMSSFGSFKIAVTDYKLWLLALIIITKTTAGAVTQFIPTRTRGWKRRNNWRQQKNSSNRPDQRSDSSCRKIAISWNEQDENQVSHSGRSQKGLEAERNFGMHGEDK